MNDEFKSLAEILKTAKAFNNIRNVAEEHRVVDEFYEIFPSLTQIAKPVKFEKKVLYVKVENSVWRNELYLKHRLFIEKINTYLEKEVVKSIKFI